MDEIRTKKIELLSSRIAALFPEDQQDGACACAGLPCMRIGCPTWWSLLLHNPEMLKQDVRIANAVRDILG